jgi:hypothetical protein
MLTHTLPQITELFGVDESSLAMLPQPVVALILLYPDTETEANKGKQTNEPYVCLVSSLAISSVHV